MLSHGPVDAEMQLDPWESLVMPVHCARSSLSWLLIKSISLSNFILSLRIGIDIFMFKFSDNFGFDRPFFLRSLTLNC